MIPDQPHSTKFMKPHYPLELTQVVTEHIKAIPWRETNGDFS